MSYRPDGGASVPDGSITTAKLGGDITSGTVATARLGSGTANGTTFLRGDQTWATPSGGGGGLSMDDALAVAVLL